MEIEKYQEELKAVKEEMEVLKEKSKKVDSLESQVKSLQNEVEKLKRRLGPEPPPKPVVFIRTKKWTGQYYAVKDFVALI